MSKSEGFTWINGKRHILYEVDSRGFRLPSKFWTEEVIKKIDFLYNHKKWSVNKIADYFKLETHSSIYRIVKENGWIRKRTFSSLMKVKQNRLKVKSMYLDHNMSCADIAKEFNVSTSTIEKYISSKNYKRTLSQCFEVSTLHGRYSKIQSKEAILNHLKTDLSVLRYEQYIRVARKLTSCIINTYLDIIDPNNKRGYKYPVDHKYSISSGYFRVDKNTGQCIKRETPLPLAIICHPANLKVISCSENLTKGSANSISLKTLKKKIRKFEKTYGRVFDTEE